MPSSNGSDHIPDFFGAFDGVSKCHANFLETAYRRSAIKVAIFAVSAYQNVKRDLAIFAISAYQNVKRDLAISAISAKLGVSVKELSTFFTR